ncbi:patatin-like phospholipase family protein, partial [Streptomyces bicolor]|uniref:patatin-like phospholipase family protein n=1 Tax=Streptomyces bicolor TaxID=66874 RepID=UPI0034DDAE0D
MTGPADFTHPGHAVRPRRRTPDTASPKLPLAYRTGPGWRRAKGAYELGVLDCMAEMGAQVSAIVGTSIGALNGAVLASEETFFHGVEQLARFWERFS